MVFDDAVVDVAMRSVTRGGESERLTRQEADLLRYLSAQDGRVVSRDELLVEVLGYRPGVVSRAVDNAIRRLRKKLEPDPRAPRFLVSVYGQGYALENAQRHLDAPAPAAAPAALHQTNLGAPPALVGRAEVLDALRRRLGQGARLVTLLGPGGAGKTCLAQALGRDQLAATPGGVWFCALTAAADARGVCAAVARALGAPGDTPEAVARALRPRGRCLLVLDNFERLVACAPETVGAWLRAADEAAFVVTSRARLRLAEEHLLPVRPLELPPVGEVRPRALFRSPAVELFVQRARQVHPDFQLERDNAAAVAALVRRLDGLPLAIELAAARARTLRPADLLDRLDRRGARGRLSLLRSTSRDGAPRHASLLAAIESSWELLDQVARRDLIRLTVFRGGFDIEAAEAALALDADEAEARVEGLVDQSLLQRRGGEALARFDLFESVRDFAASCAGEHPGALEAARDRHAEHYATLGSTAWLSAIWRGDGRARGARLRRERGNLEVALEHALAAGAGPVAARLGMALSHRAVTGGSHRQRIAVLDRALTAPGVSELERARLLRVRGVALGDARRLAEAAANLDAALALSSGDPRQEGLLWINRARIYALAGERAAGEALLDAALGRFEGLGDAHSAALAWSVRGALYAKLGGPARAARERALAGFRASGNLMNTCTTLGDLGLLAMSAGQMEQARGYLEETIDTARALGKRHTEAVARANLGEVMRHLGDWAAARAHLGDALSIYRALGRPGDLALNRFNLAEVARGEGDADRAAADYRLAIEAARGCDYPALERLAAAAAASLAAECGARDDADRLLAAAEALPEPAALEVAATTDLHRARCHLARGQAAEAAALLDRAAGKLASIEAPLLVAEARLWQARAAMACGDPSAARRAHAHAHQALRLPADAPLRRAVDALQLSGPT